MSKKKFSGIRISLLMIFLSVINIELKAQTDAFGFRLSYNDFQLEDVAKSYVTEGGDFVQMVREKFTGTEGIGAELIRFFGEKENLMFNVSAEYKGAILFGSSGFQAKYSPKEDGNNPNWGNIEGVEVKDQTSFFRTTAGFGLDLFGGGRISLILNPNLDIQYGQRVFLEDAYKAFVDRGYSQPSDFKVENSILIGFTGRVLIGFWLSEDTGLFINPGLVYSSRYDESFRGFEYEGVSYSGTSWGYEFAFTLIQKVSF